jgi:fermentation-respiration switch protein FrsA (DUF1100 family)
LINQSIWLSSEASQNNHPFFFIHSIEKVQHVRSKILVIHGTEDEVVDFSHGLAIYERAANTADPLWVEGAGHNDVELYGQYLDRLRRFVNQELGASSSS